MNTPMPTELVNGDRAIADHGDKGRLWLEAMWTADPLADAVVSDSFPDSSATAAVGAALAGGVTAVSDAPQSLRALFAVLDAEPDWVDHDRLDRAADALIQHTAALGIVLGAASLVRGAANTIAGKPLALTGRYVSQPAVRSVEVGEWLRKVISPGGMRRDGDGFAYTVRVRVIHAHVRRALVRGGFWDDSAWGVPIPQPYMAFTLAEFGHIAIEAMYKVGVRFSDRELADIYHLWRYVGHVIGMDERLNPHDEADHIRIEELYRLTSPGPGQDDCEFVEALTYDYLIPELANVLPGPYAVRLKVASKLMQSLQRVFIGDTAADELQIPDTPLKHVMTRIGPALAVVGRGRVLLAGGSERLSKRAYRERDEEMTRMKTSYRVTHEMVDNAPPTTMRAEATAD
ncbi:MAG: DUF2236 domain-containing protein [Gordonia sp.]|nr:DUF2236 domain-containing protein [Gordonia sp. (in: high G+C Gram-positive bacteria)]